MIPHLSAFGDATPGETAMFDNLRLYGTILLNLLAVVVFVGVKFVRSWLLFSQIRNIIEILHSIL